MQSLHQLTFFVLPIPLWQIVLYVGTISFLMIQRRFKFSFIASYLLILFWLHYAFRNDLGAIVSADYLSQGVYKLFGFALIVLGVYAYCFLEESADFLLDKREREIADLKVKAKHAENRASAFQAQLRNDQTKDSSSKQKLEKKLNARVDKLERQLKDGVNLLEQRDAEIAELEARAFDAEERTAALKAQLEKNQSEEYADNEKLLEELNGKIEKLERQLKKSVGIVEKRDMKIAELETEASDSKEKAAALEIQLKKAQARESAATKKLEDEFDAKIKQFARQVTESAGLLEQRDATIAELETKTLAADKNAAALKARLEKDQTEGSAATKKLENQLNDKIAKLEQQLKESETLLEKSNATIAELRANAAEADKKTADLAARLETGQIEESSKRRLQNELNAKIQQLEHQLKNSVNLLEQRDAEIASLETEASDSKGEAAALQAQLDRGRTHGPAAKKLKDELEAKNQKLEQQLKERETLLEKSNATIAELRANAAEADKKTADLAARLETGQIEESDKRRLQDELNAKIQQLEHQLKNSVSLLEQRDAEIASLETEASEADKNAAALKARFEKDQTEGSAATKKLENQLNAKITKFEQQLKERETLLEKSNAKIAELEAKSSAAEKKTSSLASPLAKIRAAAQPSDAQGAVEDTVRKKLHQFQYAVKYLEDQIKEKDRLLGLMTKKNAHTQGSNNKATIDDELKKRVGQLDQEVKYLKEQVKEKDGLLGLMAKRNRELADLKSKAEEKLEVASARVGGNQPGTGIS